ncbi:MAG: aldehyde dehydrogenase EutE [Spirochaetales bacterium]|nr:MAG: aldehyde dehydrogenase EutE [Spirochaetales bacterium]
MKIDEDSIREIVAQVMGRLDRGTASPAGSQARLPGVFSDIYEAVYAARDAFLEFSRTKLAVRIAMIKKMREAVMENLERMSRLAVEETGFGRVEHKILKNKLAAEMTPGVEDLETAAYTDDYGLMLTERAPYGVIGAISPSTNPTETIICNALGMVSAGNTVVFNSHPGAKNVSALIVSILNDAIEKAGGPKNIVTTVESPTIESAQALMEHPFVAMLVVTGGPGVVKEAMKRPKKVIAAGPGNPPAVVDETADLKKAARDIVDGASFDNNIICIDEKVVLSVASIAERLKQEMISAGAFELNAEQIERITPQILPDPGRKGHEGMSNKAYVGKNASYIAQKTLGLAVPEDTKILLCEVDREHPLVWTEQLMPVLPLTRFNTAAEAIDFALECEHGFRHTASIHSKNIDHMDRMAKMMNCSLFVKNGSNFNGMAAGGAGYTSFTIASPTGEGFTRARTFTRERRCSLIGYFRIV